MKTLVFLVIILLIFSSLLIVDDLRNYHRLVDLIFSICKGSEGANMPNNQVSMLEANVVVARYDCDVFKGNIWPYKY